MHPPWTVPTGPSAARPLHVHTAAPTLPSGSAAAGAGGADGLCPQAGSTGPPNSPGLGTAQGTRGLGPITWHSAALSP